MAQEDVKKTPENNLPESSGRRDALKALATVPLLGAMAYGVYQRQKFERTRRDMSDVFQLSKEGPTMLEAQPNGKQIRLGSIGFGIRGKQLMRAAGFAEPSWIDTLIEANKKDKKDNRYQQYLEQDDLNVVVNGANPTSLNLANCSPLTTLDFTKRSKNSLGFRRYRLPVPYLCRIKSSLESIVAMRYEPPSTYILLRNTLGMFFTPFINS